MKDDNDDYRSMYDSRFVGSWDLPTRDVVLVIDRVKGEELVSVRGKNKKPVVYFRGTEKGLVLNKTNGAAIAGMYGPRTSKWKGKPIAIYATQTSVGGETKDCIRVRPTIPKKAAQQQLAAETITPEDLANVPEDPDAGP